MKKLFLWLIRFYQTHISSFFLTLVFVPSACRFSPSCSEYMYQAVKRCGTIKGFLLGLKRIVNCHSFSKRKLKYV